MSRALNAAMLHLFSLGISLHHLALQLVSLDWLTSACMPLTLLISINVRSQQKTIINAMAVNEDGVMATGGMYCKIWRILLI